MPAAKKAPAAPKNLAELAELIGALPQESYSSMAVLVRAAHPDTPKTLATQARGIFRTLGEGVGRGKRYGVKPADWTKAYKKVLADRSRAKETAKAAKATAKEKAAVKA